MSYFQSSICTRPPAYVTQWQTDRWIVHTHTVITAELGTFGYGDMDSMLYINNMLHFTVVLPSKSVCVNKLYCFYLKLRTLFTFF